MTKFEEKKKEAYKKASMKSFGNTDGSRGMRYLLNELENAGLLKEQEALPVVPECVADYISGMKENGENIAFAIMCSTYNVAGEGNGKAIHWKDSNPEDFARAWLDGYTVEKPQLFYLKNKLTTSYLALDINTGYYEHWGEEIIPKLLNKQEYKLSFTQEEIDSMQTGSYELVPVEYGE